MLKAKYYDSHTHYRCYKDEGVKTLEFETCEGSIKYDGKYVYILEQEEYDELIAELENKEKIIKAYKGIE